MTRRIPCMSMGMRKDNYHFKINNIMYYEITDRVTRMKDDGTEKEVNERYITDSLTFAEAEQKGMEVYSGSNLDGDVVAIRRSNIREIVNENEEKEYYFRATIADISVDEHGNEKELKYYVLIRADDLSEATAKANEYLRQGLSDMKIEGIVKTRILELLK